jgi:hypothetical protein
MGGLEDNKGGGFGGRSGGFDQFEEARKKVC